MSEKRKDQICALLKAIESGDEAAIAVVNPHKYIQHNPQTHEGGEGLATLFKRLALSSPRVNIVRVFADGDYVFAHTEYDFGSPRVGFEIFRFEGDLTVEHWDNIQPRRGPNKAGHSMVDGPGKVSHPDQTEQNRELVRHFTTEVLIEGKRNRLAHYLDETGFVEHNPGHGGGLPLSKTPGNNDLPMRYDRMHRVLAEGDFVLAVGEGFLDGIHTSFYDLYRLAEGRIVEHWDTLEAVPPYSEWKNDNGKF